MTIPWHELDRGISYLVGILTGMGYTTIDSGDGSKASWMEGALDVPHVAVRLHTDLFALQRMRGLQARLENLGISCSCELSAGTDGPTVVHVFPAPLPPRNLGVLYLQTETEDTLMDWNEECLELSHRICAWARQRGHVAVQAWIDLGEEARLGDKIAFLPRGEVYPPGLVNEIIPWLFHVVPVIDGKVHCPWFPELVLPLEEFLKWAFWVPPKERLHVDILEGE